MVPIGRRKGPMEATDISVVLRRLARGSGTGRGHSPRHPGPSLPENYSTIRCCSFSTTLSLTSPQTQISLYLLSHNCSQSIRLNRSATFLIIFSSTSSTVLVFILWHSNAATSLLTGFQKLHLDCSCVVVV